ncbi:hypothetical protein [Actinomycetospora straminea]|uniref:DoxX-like protein n=1 Tax=Actinomycetospora straminea TaxID=663607 RepID=A0ABP9F075_9PSEU|nr:hypothetical protein [Actinomycetospora straminea]MDD7935771.1 hypothetical protein [Actinomycetospora straminea]
MTTTAVPASDDEDDRSSPAATSPAATSPAATSPAATSPAGPPSRAPVLRPDAAASVRLVAVAFGVTVVGTRLYLELTGYPQIGGGEYHLAHALWGGLLLLLGGLTALLWSDAWVPRVTAVCVGVGSGLFVDEVGKFITARNDYFTPLAAPIIYGVFLGVLGVSVLARRPEHVPETRPSRPALTRAEDLLLPRWAHRLLLITGSALLGLLSLVGLVVLVALWSSDPGVSIVLDDRVVPPGTRPPMLVVASAGEAVVGVLLVLAAGALALGRDRVGVRLCRAGLLVALAGVNVALGYLDAELVVSAVVVELALLVLAGRYRSRFVP